MTQFQSEIAEIGTLKDPAFWSERPEMTESDRKFLPGILNCRDNRLDGRSAVATKRPPSIHIPSVVTTVPKFCRRLSKESWRTILPS